MTETYTVSLQDGIDELEQSISELEDEAENVQEQLREEFPDDEERPHPSETDAGQTVENALKKCKKRAQYLKQKKHDWGDAQFVYKDLSFGQIMTISDEVRSASFEVESDGSLNGIPQDGYHKVLTLRHSLSEIPNAAPDDPADFDYQLGQWLYEKIDEKNTAEGVTVGNLWNDQN